MATAEAKFDDPVAHSVAVQLPTFNRLAPSAWFHLADANFHLRGIKTSETKYWYVVSKLDQETLKKLSAFLAKPRGPDPYTEIREVLCTAYEPQLEQKLDALLATKELGDDRPAEFLLELRRLCADATVDDILKRIFVRSLPTRLADAISGNLDGSLDALARAADKAWALAANNGATVAAVSATTAPVPPDSIGVPVGTGHPIAAVTAGAPARGRGSRQRGNRQVRPESRAVVLCPFHVKWGDAARRCLPTCSRWQARAPQQVFQVEEAMPDTTASEN